MAGPPGPISTPKFLTGSWLTVVSDQQFQYSAARDMTGWQQKNGPAVNYNWGLGYDGADQLTSVAPTAATTAPNVTQRFSYDLAGNWTQNTLTAGNKTAAYNNLNQLTRLTSSGNSVPLVYDLDGNITSKNGSTKPSTTYAWDAANRLVSIGYNQTGQTVTASQISYDGLGRIVKLVEKNGATTLQDRRFVWLNDALYQERNA
jgi:YD repeat-containing protein